MGMSKFLKSLFCLRWFWCSCSCCCLMLLLGFFLVLVFGALLDLFLVFFGWGWIFLILVSYCFSQGLEANSLIRLGWMEDFVLSSQMMKKKIKIQKVNLEIQPSQKFVWGFTFALLSVNIDFLSYRGWYLFLYSLDSIFLHFVAV